MQWTRWLDSLNKLLFILKEHFLLVAILSLGVVLRFYGLGLILVIPFYFHVKGIIYREMFGIRLKVVAKDKPNDEDDNGHNSQMFNA